MALPGSPRLPRSCLAQHTRSATTSPEMEALRRRAWHQHGVASLSIDEITDPWLRQAVPGPHRGQPRWEPVNEATRRWGARNGGHHGR
jgi:hypothetical protein